MISFGQKKIWMFFVFVIVCAFLSINIFTLASATEYAHTIDDDIVLASDMVVDGNLKINSGKTVNLNGHTLQVKGNLDQEGHIIVGRGNVLVEADYNLWGSATLNMNHESDMIFVGGDFYVRSTAAHVDRLTDGVIEFKGNFTQRRVTYGAYTNFQATGNHLVVFSGDGEQVVDMGSSLVNQSRFNNIDVKSTGNVDFATVAQFVGNIKFTTDNFTGRLTPAGEEATVTGGVWPGDLTTNESFKLLHDMDIKGNLSIPVNSAIDINGKTVKVDGDYVQTSGEVILNGGNLEVAGDMRVSGHYFTMTKPDDYLLVNGDFLINTTAAHTDRLTDGVMEFKGNFTQRRVSYGAYTNFQATGNHLVVFSGDGEQVVDMGSGLVNQSRFNNIDVKSTGNVDFATVAQFVGNIKFTTDNFTGRLTPAGEEATVTGGVWPGDLTTNESFKLLHDMDIKGNLSIPVNSAIDINGKTVKVDGDYVQTSGEVILNGGNLEVAGDMRVSGHYFTMTKPDDYLLVNGDFLINTTAAHTDRLTDGVMEFKGNFTQRRVSYGAYTNFQATGNHLVVFSGDGDQVVDMGSGLVNQSRFNNIDVKSTGNVDFATVAQFVGNIKFTTDNFTGRLTPAGEEATVTGGVWPGDLTTNESFKLLHDMDIKGNLSIPANSAIDINGKTVKVDGDYVQTSGEVILNGGSLEVAGDMRVSGNYFTMTDPDDYLLVNGDFLINTYYSHVDRLTDGVMEFKGNFTQRRVTHGNHTNFHATGNHLVVFSGDGDQVVDMASSLVTQSRFKNIMINTGGAVDFGTRAQFTGEIEFKTVNYLGDISPAEEARVKGNIWPGKLSVHQDWLVTQDIITDSFELKGGETDINALKLRVLEDGRISNGTLNANQGELIVDGEMDQTQGELRVGKGSVNIFGNYSIFDGYLTMTDPEGYLLVRGDFTMRSYYNHSTRIVDGVMEIKGDFAQHRNSSWGASNSNFKATDNHKIIFSGESAQNVSFSHPNSTSQSSFANLEIKNSEGVDFVTRSPFTGNLDHMDGTFSGNITPAQQATVQEGVWPGNLIVYEQWEMQDDLSVKGHLNATSGTIEVNGRELTVENNTLISGGRIDVNGGSLVTINDLNMTSGYLTINTGDALIGGDLTQSSNNISYIDVSGGRLEIKGDYNNLQDGFLYMKDPNDYVKIHGDFNMNSRRSHSGHLTDGVLEVKGDFAQRRYGGYGPVSDNFKATENHKVLLSGEGIQQVSFTNSSGAVSSFANLEIDNGEKVVFTTGAVATKQIDFISDDIEGALSPSGMAVVTGGLWPRDLILSDSWRMPHDLHINGDLKLANGTLYVNGKDISFAIEKGNMSVEGGNLDLQDSNLEVPLDIAITRGTLGLNGGKLSVNGDLSHGGGAYWSYVELDGGQLEVAGSYSMQSESLLRMDDPEDHIIIHGDFMTDSRGNHTGRLTDGVIELKGSFTQRRHGGYAPTSNNFRSTDSHKVIFSGNSVQEIYFGNPGTNLSHFADVEFNNPLGVELKSRVCVTEEITLNKTEVINPSNLYLALNGRISGNEWPFDFYVYENLKLQDNMVVYGKVHKISGEIDYDGYKILSVEEVDASSVNIGETLEKSRLTGIFKDPETDEAVEGELSWVEPETMVDSIYQSHSWIFRPSSDDYMEASGNVGIQGHPVMTGIKITSEPDKRVYDATEDFDITGLKVYSVWNYGDDQQLDLSDLTITGFDSSLPTEKQRVLVSYMGYSESFDVEIRAIEVEAVDVEAESANIGTTLESAVLSGEFLDSKTKEPIEGILEWVDESLQVTKLSEEFEWRFIPEEPKYTLVTGYMQVIGNPVLTGIEIARLPDKLEYEIGEEIDLDGLLVQSRWNYGSSRNISNSLLSVSGFDSTEATERQSITLGYDGFEASFGIKVNPPVEVIAVSIEDGESQELITQVIIDRQETLNGELQDKIIIGEEAAKEIIEHLKASSGDTARVRFPVGDEKVTMQTIEIPSETLAELKGKGINLEIDSDWGNIIIPKESLDEVDGSEVLYFRLVPIKSVDELKEIDETTQNQDIIKEVAGDGKIQRFALSMRIESNMAGHKVKITLPLDLRLLPNDNEQRANLLDDLWVYVEHSDGDRELIKPSVNTGFREGFVGMTFEVEKFSRFTLLRINQVDIAKPIEPVEDEQDFEQEPEEQREEVRKANNEEADNQQSMGEGTNTEEAIFVEREEDISKETEDETLEETIEADGTISEDIEEAKERKEERGIWKYAIIALALAVIAGMAVKKKK